VHGYVDASRERGNPVERVIIDMKREMDAAGMIDRYATREDRLLAESVVRWCIERFYEPPVVEHPTTCEHRLETQIG
jgi:hypothetical protein